MKSKVNFEKSLFAEALNAKSEGKEKKTRIEAQNK
jgi:hypothetical protein